MKNNIIILFVSILTSFTFIPSSTTFADTEVYQDVPKHYMYYQEITYLLNMDVIEPAHTFGVTKTATREEVAVMIAKAVGLDGTQRKTKFKDVPANHPNSGYIQSAVEAGIINGYPDGTFQPNTLLNRGHMAAFISRAYDLPMGSAVFKDVPKGHTAYEAVKQLVASEITTGYEDGTFKPEKQLTRAHTAVFVARAMKFKARTDSNEKPLTLPVDDRESIGIDATKGYNGGVLIIED